MEDGFFKSTLISFFTKNLGRLAKALRGDCKELTGLVVESLVEGMVAELMRKQGKTGKGWSFLRNSLADALHSSEFSKSLEGSFESAICDLYHKFTGKAQDLYTQLKPQAGATPAAG